MDPYIFKVTWAIFSSGFLWSQFVPCRLYVCKLLILLVPSLILLNLWTILKQTWKKHLWIVYYWWIINRTEKWSLNISRTLSSYRIHRIHVYSCRRYLVLVILAYDSDINFEPILPLSAGINCNYLLYVPIVGKKLIIFIMEKNFFQRILNMKLLWRVFTIFFKCESSILHNLIVFYKYK